ncbi:hypothetical protein KSD_87420 [Ktedonobacter sp. SOSP1-85]|uniref:SDR family NAD(P)-dependent oxidoreductase n=1 Tax=Ktedonobacter sp. SOSP1-85 TaxID=2778367 RepID=UPI001915280B|nr:SDR family NAD(P)-dependent oxidoreductase [Ktedonobacter sp. SOSP1-85]GHO80971.1 hypothetical protein KSD_87420 [Ktedonobacter sp. SOSP1-85]
MSPNITADTSPVERIAVEKSIIQQVDKVIAQCPSEWQELIEEYGADPSRLVLIPAAANTTLLRPVTRALARQEIGLRQLGIPKSAFTISYVGRLLPRKDVRNIVFAKAAFPWLRQQGGGHIFNIASTAATRAWANASPYHASKWGLLGFSRGLSVEGRPHNIRVTTLIPGGMDTHFFDRFLDQGIPMPDKNNLQSPANVAATMVFAAQLPPESALQELIVTPLNETSWP